MLKVSILPTIIDNYENFTNVEKTIADYFMSNKHKGDFSSKIITKKLFVSEASLSRFAQKLGFRGYREFVYKYEESFMEESKKIPYGFQDVLNTYHQLLRQMVDYVDEKKIKDISNLISTAKYVLVLGVGSSGFVAREMKNRFMRLGVLMEALDQADEMRMQSIFQNKDNLVIGISLSGKKKEVLFALKHAYHNGAKTVIITANSNEKYDYCTEKIIVPSVHNLDSGNIISPQFPILVILDLCYNYFYHNETNQDKHIKLHKKTVEILDEE